MQTFQTLMFTKVSICLFLLRIPVETHLIRPLQVTIAVLVVSNVILTILWIVQCRPLAAAWNSFIQGHCFSEGELQRIIIAQALISIISDFMLAIFPVFILWKVQISPRVKAGLCALMSMGLITAACCIVRTVLNWQNVNQDPTWASIDNWYWRSWEVCIGIVAASIPTLRPGYKRLASTISTYRSRRSSRKTSSTLHNRDPTRNTKHKGFDSSTAELAKGSRVNGQEGLIYGVGGKERNIMPLQDLKIKKTTTIDVDNDMNLEGHSRDRQNWVDGAVGRRVEDII